MENKIAHTSIVQIIRYDKNNLRRASLGHTPEILSHFNQKGSYKKKFRRCIFHEQT